MKNKTTSLAQLRTDANVHIEDIAYLLNLDLGKLSQLEYGFQKPDVETILFYHILFKANLVDMFKDEYADIQAQLVDRSTKLIAKLKNWQSSKSTYRLKYVQKVVNQLNSNTYED